MSDSSTAPTVSVVMSTYDDVETLERALDSVLSQTLQDLELIVVNDGAPDPATAAILARVAERDSRVTVITRSNEGLTRALMAGCDRARAPFIARQDADDVSAPTRLSRQVGALAAASDAALCVCGTRLVAPGGETLDEVIPIREPAELTRRVHDDMRGVPSHGCTMFRRSAYEAVGGYRACFYYAQDTDLWLRLVEAGPVVGVPDVLYELHQSAGSISVRHREQQGAFCNLAQHACRLRREGQDETPAIERAAALRRDVLALRGTAVTRRDDGQANRLFAARLRQRGDAAARRYAWRALRQNPLSWRAWCEMLRSGVHVGRRTA